MPPSVSTVDSSPIRFEPLPYRTGCMWVCSSTWIGEVVATPRVKSCWPRLRHLVVAPARASLLVRVRTPNRSDRCGSDPSVFMRCSSSCVPQVPGANTTCSAV